MNTLPPAHSLQRGTTGTWPTNATVVFKNKNIPYTHVRGGLTIGDMVQVAWNTAYHIQKIETENTKRRKAQNQKHHSKVNNNTKKTRKEFQEFEGNDESPKKRKKQEMETPHTNIMNNGIKSGELPMSEDKENTILKQELPTPVAYPDYYPVYITKQEFCMLTCSNATLYSPQRLSGYTGTPECNDWLALTSYIRKWKDLPLDIKPFPPHGFNSREKYNKAITRETSRESHQFPPRSETPFPTGLHSPHGSEASPAHSSGSDNVHVNLAPAYDSYKSQSPDATEAKEPCSGYATQQAKEDSTPADQPSLSGGGLDSSNVMETNNLDESNPLRDFITQQKIWLESLINYEQKLTANAANTDVTKFIEMEEDFARREMLLKQAEKEMEEAKDKLENEKALLETEKKTLLENQEELKRREEEFENVKKSLRNLFK